MRLLLDTLLTIAPFKKDILDIVKDPTFSIEDLARELNNSIRNTKFINIPIEHVSDRGITEGTMLNAHSNTDVGFHFSPINSLATHNILQVKPTSFVRTGIWTYTNNTRPIFVTDTGNWCYCANPEIYKGVNPGNTLTENVLALDRKGPNYIYINKFEGLGTKSYMTTLTNFICLSKNIFYKSII